MNVFPSCSIHLHSRDADFETVVFVEACLIIENTAADVDSKMRRTRVQPIVEIVFRSASRVNTLSFVVHSVERSCVLRKKMIPMICSGVPSHIAIRASIDHEEIVRLYGCQTIYLVSDGCNG